MPVTVISTNTFVTGAAYTPAASGDDLFVLPNITLMSTNTTATTIDYSEVTLHIEGSLIGFSRAATFNNTAAYGHLYVGTSGMVRSFQENSNEAAVVFFSTQSGVTNHGVITAPEAIALYVGGSLGDVLNTGLITGATGVQFASNAGNSRLVNHGTITGSNQFDGSIDAFEGRGVLVQAGGAYVLNAAGGRIGSTANDGSGLMAAGLAGGLVFNNYGDVWAVTGTGINLSNVLEGQSLIRVVNTGTISGQNGSYTGSINADQLTNRGEMIGDVLMGDGLDKFDNRRGTVEGNVDLGAGNDTCDTRGGTVWGTVQGGEGDDTFRGDATRGETFLGGAGTADALDFRSGPRVIVALDESFTNDGAALGDSFDGFENVHGSQIGSDSIRGNADANILIGYGGNDTLQGAEGSDLLRGEAGVDRLTGGGGNDTFRYLSLTHLGDVITDFSSAAAGNNDRFLFLASVFAGGGPTGTLAASAFRSRTDNLAQDANDRFIFRTTDTTLWFDQDGAGGASAIMVADLQAGASVSASDIVIL